MDGINKLLALSARMKPAEDILVRKIRVGNIPVLILRPRRSGSLKKCPPAMRIKCCRSSIIHRG